MKDVSMTRRDFLYSSSCSALALAAPALGPMHSTAAAERPVQAPPNVILILADDLGYGDLGSYGQKMIQTPRLDQMAAEGMRFTHCYAGSCVCAPSRCCLMTGLHNGHGRIRDNIPHEIWLRPDDITVAEVLKQAGYHTGAIGKWSLGNPGSWGVANYQGFDYFYGHLDQDQAHFYYPDYLWENDKVVQLEGNRGGKRGQYTCDLFTEKALAFVEDHREDPFFLYLAYTWPHWSDYEKDTADSLPVPSDAPYTGESWPQVEKNYAAMVSRLDRDVGRLLDHLKALGLDENTLVLFTSDNGPSAEASHSVDFFQSRGGLRGVKREIYEGGIRVPMIARWPGHVPPGSVNDLICAGYDVLPTLAELSGLPETSGVDGISIAPTLLGQQQPRQHDYLYWDYAHVRGTFAQAVRSGQWKALRNGPDAPLELYDLSVDAGETRNLAQEHPEVVQRLEGYIREAYVPSPDYPIAPAAKV